MEPTRIVAIVVPVVGITAVAVIVTLYLWLRKQDAGTSRMQTVAGFIQVGANAFLRREFRTIGPFVLALALVLLVAMPEGNWQIALGFVLGATLSLLAVFVGMNAAVRANVRTASMARGPSHTIAITGAEVMYLIRPS